MVGLSPISALPPSGQRAVARCDLLGRAPYSDDTDGLFRPYLGAGYRATLDRIAGWMDEAGMSVRVDAVGNVVGRYEGTVPDAPSLLIGSHVDSVRNGGRYDGMLGVILGVEVVAGFARAGRRFPFAIEVIGFGDEEGSRFPAAMLTSRTVAGVRDGFDLSMADRDGITLAEALAEFGLDLATIDEARIAPDRVLAYVEAHIEQGPVLEAEGRAVGVVSAIAAQHRYRVTMQGMAGHAGTIAMHLRRDALAAAAEAIGTVERVGNAGPADLVATVGRLEVQPGAANVVPGDVMFTIDVRAGTNAVRDAAARAIIDEIRQIAARRDITLDVTLQQDLDATPCDPRLTVLMEQAVADVTGTPARVLVSGAGHDAMVMAHRVPVSMLFIRCEKGISHNPAEAVTAADVEVALRALTDFVCLFEGRS
ncbi:allantoate amidohydrolase [Gluconacetobacter entanii]|uniref:allantoate amidohydrolase n=1 Tax=Gluconacetobacter entanii TaxID=108528 RepID=UPI001C93637B|nr:allantoate amidohydrolase [Gluconacetobacter entanii]MBY4640235.1 allantoate amidohydrolase [Gluconacetobacter entanii]MCW4582181.1 allantoate amidohydrolase [Gluconacetobacter entanii]MCW4585460.1 allantoate amidohydrolase [Gluconacetobacter entanii]MCW4588579.1 allantoate amidohydrolase [Gluconacetobacter entanii]